MGERQVPALLRAKINAEDNVSISKTVGMKTGYMVLSEFEQELGFTTAKIFPRESSCIAYAQGQEIIEVDVVRKFK